jgi:hypothetical protein
VVGASTAPHLLLSDVIWLALVAGASVTDFYNDAVVVVPAFDVLQLV